MNDPGVPAPANRGLTPPFGAGWLPLRSRRVHLLCLTLLSLSVYANTLSNGFVWDDRLLIVESKTIKDWSNLPLVLTGDFFQESQARDKIGYYRPLITLSYIVDYTLWGLNPFGFHLTNLFFHALTSLAVYLIALRLLGKGLAPFLASVFFALHPIHTESVAWISGRTDVIATTFLLLSWLLYLNKRPQRSWGSLLAFALALLAKEIALIFPVLLFLGESLFNPPPWRERLRRVFPFVALLGLYLVFRFVILGIFPANPVLMKNGRYRLFLTFLEAIWIYGGKLLIPINLNAYYSMPVATSLFQPTVLFSLLALAGVSLILWSIRNRDKAIVFSLLLFVIALLPASNLVSVAAQNDRGFAMAERFIYLPSVGFSLFLALLASRTWTRFQRWPGRILVASAVLVVVMSYSGSTVARNRVWRDDLTFYRETLKQAPFSSFLHYNLGVVYRDLGRLDLAEKEWREAVRLDPAASQARNNLGNILFLQGSIAEAAAEWAAAVKTDPRNAEAHYNLARALDAAGRLQEARDLYGRFLRIAPEKYAAVRAAVEVRVNQIEDRLSGSVRGSLGQGGDRPQGAITN